MRSDALVAAFLILCYFIILFSVIGSYLVLTIVGFIEKLLRRRK